MWCLSPFLIYPTARFSWCAQTLTTQTKGIHCDGHWYITVARRVKRNFNISRGRGLGEGGIDCMRFAGFSNYNVIFRWSPI